MKAKIKLVRTVAGTVTVEFETEDGRQLTAYPQEATEEGVRAAVKEAVERDDAGRRVEEFAKRFEGKEMEV